MDRFTDSDGDIWLRGANEGEVKWAGSLCRLQNGTVRNLIGAKWEVCNPGSLERGAREAIAALWPEAERPNSTTPSIVDAPTPRRIVQLMSLGDGSVCARCSDDTVWRCNDYHSWRQLPSIPQD